jgi:hypothetical protein
MEGARFNLLRIPSGGVEPGIWVTGAVIDGEDVEVSVDLIVPEAASDGEGRRGGALFPTATAQRAEPLGWRPLS